MIKEKQLLVDLFQRCGKAELAFLVNSGFGFGVALGVLQMLLWLVYEMPWTLAAGGAVVGYLTNLIALKLIFEPIEPTRIGPFMVQGMFLRRQHEVSAEFADCMTEKLLASETLWDGILTGPGAGKFRELLEARTAAFMGGAAAVLYGGDHPTEFAGGWWRQLERRVSGRVMELLPTELPLIHGYVDDTLGLRETLKVNLRKLSPAEFEQVLHPVFQEDELTLVLVGAVLGLAVGYAQCVWDARDKRLAREAAEAGPAPPETYIGAAAAAAPAPAAWRTALGGLAQRAAGRAPPPPPPPPPPSRPPSRPRRGRRAPSRRPPPPSPPPSPRWRPRRRAGSDGSRRAMPPAEPPPAAIEAAAPGATTRTIRRRRRASAGCAPASPRARCAGCAATPSPRRRMASSGAERFDRVCSIAAAGRRRQDHTSALRPAFTPNVSRCNSANAALEADLKRKLDILQHLSPISTAAHADEGGGRS